jgi:hypothetical protein
MTRTLKERYESNRVKSLQERVKRIDEDVIAEHRFAQLLVEAMDENDLNKVQAIVQKLSKIKNPALPRLTAAIEQAEAEINKYTAGGPLTKGWAKMKKLVGIDNPIVKVTTFADALEKGFAQIPTILKNNGIDLKSADLSKSLATTLAAPAGAKGGAKTGAKSDADMGKSVTGKNVPDKDDNYSVPGIGEADGDVNIEGKLKNVVAQLQKALSPGGIFGVFKKVPYIGNAELAQELVKAPLKVFSQIVKVVNSGAKAAEVAPDIKDQVTGQGGVETKGTQTPASAAATGQTGQAAPTKDPTVSSNTTGTGQQTPQPQGGGSGTNYAAAKQKLMPILKNAKNIDAIVKKLVDAGLDVSKL